MSPEPLDLFAEAPVGYVVLDDDAVILAANRAMLELLGRTHDEVVGRLSLPSLVSAGGRIFFDTHVFPMLGMGATVKEVALEVIRRDGVRVPVLVNANRTTDPGGEARVRVVVMETSDRRRYEQDLLEAKRAAEEAQHAAARLAETLQRTFIPPTPPRIEGLEIAAAYRPAGDGSVVGGDFYDVFRVSDREWVVVVGDVMGKGVAAASVTSFVRHSVRALAVEVRDPAELLRHLNRALLDYPTDRFCTVVVLRLEQGDAGWQLEGAAGGHPLPLVRDVDGAVGEIGVPGSLVGLLSTPTFTTFRQELGRNTLVMYTDGVVEGRRGHEQFGVERLRQVVAGSGGSLAQLTDSIVAGALAHQDQVPEDDIAVVALRAEAVSL